MGLEVNWDSFHNAIQNQTDAIKVRRELEETAISELHVMGGQRFGIGGNEKTNTDARQMRQMNGYPLRSFLATGGAIVVPPKHSEGLLATPMNVGLTQYTQYNGVVGNYVSSFTEPLNAPLDNQSILLGRAGIAARSESASNPFKTLQFMLNMHETQQSITDNERGHQNIRGYNQQGVMQDSVNAMQAPMKEAAKKRQLEQEQESPKLARPKKQSSTTAEAWIAERKDKARIIKSAGSTGYLERHRAEESKLAEVRGEGWRQNFHNQVNPATPIERKEDGTVTTIQHQQVQYDQEALVNMRLRDAEEEKAMDLVISTLNQNDRATYESEIAAGFSHDEIMKRFERNDFSVLESREELLRQQQMFHIVSNAGSPNSDNNQSILSELTNTMSGGKMVSLANSVDVSKTLYRSESSTPNLASSEIALSFIPLPPSPPQTKSSYVSQTRIKYKAQQDTSDQFGLAGTIFPSPGVRNEEQGRRQSYGGDITQFTSNPNTPASQAVSETFFNKASRHVSSMKKSKVVPIDLPVQIHPSTHRLENFQNIEVLTPRRNIVPYQTAGY
jgi:hypothetical protein